MKKATSLLILALVLMAGCVESPPGSDRDEHGCIGSAGYSWCELKGKCIRSWEEPCAPATTSTAPKTAATTPTKVVCTEEAKICPDGSAVGRIGPSCEFAPCPTNQIIGGDRDSHGCLPSAGYTWCDAKQKCIRPWEENCTAAAPSGNATADEVNAVVDANNQFGFDLYQRLRSDPSNSGSNLFYSPYSISAAMAMTYEGARQKTRDEMQAVLHLPADDGARMEGFASVMGGINKNDKKYQLSTANALWAQKDFAFLQAYFDLVGRYYGGGVTNLDYKGDLENSRQTINSWVLNKTNGKIKDLIPPGVLTPLTRLVLTNAVYFKGDWVKQFDKNDTKEKDFQLGSGQTAKARMMTLPGGENRFPYAEIDGVQALEMPYSGDEISMVILLPKVDGLEGLEQSISQQKFQEMRAQLRPAKVVVSVPKFKLETKTYLGNNLALMGMPAAFSDSADFSGMTGKKDLKIDQVIHQAYVDVNEEGTEAAAATGVIMSLTAVAVPVPPKVFNADHPFMFFILEKQTGNILFMGRVTNPGNAPQEAGSAEGDRHVCTQTEHSNKACTMEYNPVCGWFNSTIRCFKYPCAQIYGNGCTACSDGKVEYYTLGVCPADSKPPTTLPQIANPASVYCENNLAGRLTIVDTPEGQVGYCKLPNGMVCEEWSLLRSNGMDCKTP